MIRSIFIQAKRRLPIVNILLIASCLIATLPQFFLSNVYSEITGQVFTFKSFYLMTLNSFTHSPDMLTIHLIGNILVFIFFGVIVEIIIGSKRFAVISILTLVSTTLVNILHTDGIYLGHGASGIAWGYHTFYIFILVLLYENRGKKIFKDGYIVLSFALLLFDIFGIPIFEVFIQKRGFFDNFGQVLHLVSMLVVVPFIFLWRKDIELNLKKLITGEAICRNKNYINTAVVLIVIIVLLNTFGTYKAINLTSENDGKIAYSISPPVGITDIVDIPQVITVKFVEKVKSVKRTSTSINYNADYGKVIIKEEWKDDKTLEIRFNRGFKKGENIKLIYNLVNEIEDNIIVHSKIFIEYR